LTKNARECAGIEEKMENEEEKDLSYKPRPERYFENPEQVDEVISLLSDLTAFTEISHIALYPEFIKQIIDVLTGMKMSLNGQNVDKSE
jgi:hypothetical protein